MKRLPINMRGIALVVVSLLTFVIGEDTVKAAGGTDAVASTVEKVLMFVWTVVASFMQTKNGQGTK